VRGLPHDLPHRAMVAVVAGGRGVVTDATLMILLASALACARAASAAPPGNRNRGRYTAVGAWSRVLEQVEQCVGARRDGAVAEFFFEG
jgi:hypothetical protein